MQDIGQTIANLEKQRNEFNDNWVDFAGVNQSYDIAINNLKSLKEFKDKAESTLKNISEGKYDKEDICKALENLIGTLSEMSNRTRWIVDKDDRHCKCSKCGFRYDIWNNKSQGLPEFYHYCPRCGFNMNDNDPEYLGEKGAWSGSY